jgi:rare lipoprotein A
MWHLLALAPEWRLSAEVGRAARWSSLLAALLLAACASRPDAGGRAGGGGEPTRLPPVTARHPDRDGPPLDAPPNLAQLPDPVPQVEPIRQGGPNKPYVVLGQAYEPVAADTPFKQRGLASWYGTKFHGRKTASGELFSVNGFTAAHRTLPIPSYARVRSVATGKEIIVRVNDRGPFHSARMLDLSYAAAVKLGIVSLGQAEVEIERLTFDEIRSGAWRRGTALDPDAALASASGGAAGPAGGAQPAEVGGSGLVVTPPLTPAPTVLAVAAPVVPAATSAPLAESTSAALVATVEPGAPARAYTTTAKGFWVQLAALGRQDGVDRLQQRVLAQLQALAPLMAVFHESALFKLQVGPYGSREQAQAAAHQAREALQLTPMVIERR